MVFLDINIYSVYNSVKDKNFPFSDKLSKDGIKGKRYLRSKRKRDRKSSAPTGAELLQYIGVCCYYFFLG